MLHFKKAKYEKNVYLIDIQRGLSKQTASKPLKPCGVRAPPSLSTYIGMGFLRRSRHTLIPKTKSPRNKQFSLRVFPYFPKPTGGADQKYKNKCTLLDQRYDKYDEAYWFASSGLLEFL
jgi:hypothetical protein